LGVDGIDALCGLLASGTLSDRQQLRALQGLLSAMPARGYREWFKQRFKLLEAALPRVCAPHLAMRSRAAHTVVGTIEMLEGPRWGDEHPSELASLRAPATPPLREGLALGFQEPTRQRVERFLASTSTD
jgi:hypothetical protein